MRLIPVMVVVTMAVSCGTRDRLAEDVGLRDESATQSQFDCSTRLSTYQSILGKYVTQGAPQTCSVDADCMQVDPGVSCWGTCPSVANTITAREYQAFKSSQEVVNFCGQASSCPSPVFNCPIISTSVGCNDGVCGWR